MELAYQALVDELSSFKYLKGKPREYSLRESFSRRMKTGLYVWKQRCFV